LFCSLQKKLSTLTSESERLKSEITSRNDLLTRIEAETTIVEDVSANLSSLPVFYSHFFGNGIGAFLIGSLKERDII